MDFTPRYLREDDTGSWLSDNSAAATVEVHSDPGTKLMMIRTMVMLMLKMSNKLRFTSTSMMTSGCNGTVPSGYSPDGVMTSDDGSSLGMQRLFHFSYCVGKTE